MDTGIRNVFYSSLYHRKSFGSKHTYFHDYQQISFPLIILILFLSIQRIGFQGRLTISCLSVTINAQFLSQALTFLATSFAFSEFIIFSNESSLILPMIHSSEDPLQGETFPQGSIKKKSLNAPQGGLYPGSSPRNLRWMLRLK